MGRPWELVSQTSETESVAISLLKHLNGDPLSTARTCLSPIVSHEVLVALVPRGPHLTDGTGALVGILLKALLERLVLRDFYFRITTFYQI